MATWKLLLEYDGRPFSGWQRQANAHSIQAEVETQLAVVFGGERIVLHAAGRTDAGVHALGQVVSFRAATARSPERVRLALNGLLPDAVSCLDAAVVDDTFHARFSAVGKTYRYVVLDRPSRSPFWSGRAYHSRRALDWSAVEAGLAHLVGTHDFSSFRGPVVDGRDPVRTVERAEHRHVDGVHHLEFAGRGFLRYQVRIMVGTLLEIGAGRRVAAEMPALLAARDRALAGRTAQPGGLYLVEVRYGPVAAGLRVDPPPDDE